MTIHPRPDQEIRIQEALQAGLIHSAEDVIDAGLEHLQVRPSPQPSETEGRAGQQADKERALAAAARIRELRKGVTLGGLTIRELIDEGRP